MGSLRGAQERGITGTLVPINLSRHPVFTSIKVRQHVNQNKECFSPQPPQETPLLFFSQVLCTLNFSVKSILGLRLQHFVDLLAFNPHIPDPLVNGRGNQTIA